MIKPTKKLPARAWTDSFHGGKFAARYNLPFADFRLVAGRKESAGVWSYDVMVAEDVQFPEAPQYDPPLGETNPVKCGMKPDDPVIAP